jgi:alpha-glucosidase
VLISYQTGNWLLGSITNEEPRNLKIKTDFLEPGKKYKTIVYADGENAHWNDNPTSYRIISIEADHTTEIELNLAAGGGAAIGFFKLP